MKKAFLAGYHLPWQTLLLSFHIASLTIKAVYIIKLTTQLLLGWLAIVLLLVAVSACQTNHDRSFYDRNSMGLAPDPLKTESAVVQIYAARAARWRGIFAVHCWIAVKDKGADSYEVLQIIGWRLRRTGSAIVRGNDIPDRKWFGSDAELLFDLQGVEAEAVIPKIRKAADDYPYGAVYRAWPGPNSNTYIAHIIRSVPELTVELPPHAIGKDWLPDGIFAMTESGSGLQVSLYGLLGLSAGLAEGIEFNLLGLAFGFDIRDPALKLPMLGRLGFADTPL